MSQEQSEIILEFGWWVDNHALRQYVLQGDFLFLISDEVVLQIYLLNLFMILRILYMTYSHPAITV